jgi:hypothetical protein
VGHAPKAKHPVNGLEIDRIDWIYRIYRILGHLNKHIIILLILENPVNPGKSC